MMVRSLLLIILSLTLSCNASAQPQTAPQEPQGFLRNSLHFSNSEIAALERGEILKKTLKTSERREVAAFGAMYVNVPIDFFLDQFRDIVHFRKSESVLETGKFKNPPQLDDLRGLTLESSDLKAIKDCKIGDCDVRFSSEHIVRLHQIDWSAKDWKSRVDSLVRKLLIEYVQDYLDRGNDALCEYHDQDHPVRLIDEFRSILKETPSLFDYAPEFKKYLENFPKEPLTNTESFLYWSKEKFGFKPVLSITHATIYQPPPSSSILALIASRQIYASHYFDASLGLTVLIHAGEKPGVYLLYLNRSRTAALKGAFSGLRRVIVESRARDAMKKNLKLIKQRIESAYAARQTGQAH